MSHVYTSQQDPSGQRLTLEETRELIERLERRRVPDNTVTVQEVADALGIPSSQVLEMVGQMRAKPPISSSTWLKRNLWVWIPTALAAIFVGMQGYIFWMNQNVQQHNRNLADTRFPYAAQARGFGEGLLLEAPGGFSFTVSNASREAAVLGKDSGYPRVSKLTKSGIEKVQGHLADDIVSAFDQLARLDPPGTVGGDQFGTMEPNYYRGGPSLHLQVVLPEGAFPYSADNPASRTLRADILRQIKEHWSELTDEVVSNDFEFEG